MNILDQIFECGIVGCGGAGFPTHVKLNTQVEYFIVNAAECEPLLRTDRYTMKHRAGDIIDAVEAIGDHLKAAKKVIALKGHYHEEIACLEEAIAAKNSDVELFFLENFYPAGDEQIMVYEVTGRVIPPAGIPSAVNAVVSNVGTVAAISDAMSAADPANSEKYNLNSAGYNDTLSSLDKKYEDAVKNAGRDTLLFGDRFPFRYLTDDYDLKYYAAFAGCSAETEASFDTVVFLSNKVDELGLKAVITIDSGDQAIAKTIIDNTTSKDQEILVLDSMQSTKTSDNRSYVQIMESNLEVLKKALG